MKRLLVISVVIIFLLLDYSALDDITTGNEPDYFWEYATLFASLLYFGFLGFMFWRKKRLY